METEVLGNIPRLYTALADWLACLLYLFFLPKRTAGWRRYTIHAVFLLLLGVFMQATGQVPQFWFLPCIAVSILIMYLYIRMQADVPARSAGYYCVRAFILGELAASLEWQLYYYMAGRQGTPGAGARVCILAVDYAAVYGAVFALERNYNDIASPLHIHKKEFLSTLFIGVAVYAASNLSYVSPDTPFSGKMTAEIYNIRTLVDLGGMAILFAHHMQLVEYRRKKERDALQNVLQAQYAQYRSAQDSIDLINKKYHDLKHQIAVLRSETSEEKAHYLDAMEQEIRSYEAQNKTGNEVLDTILTSKSLYCQQHGITLTCVADGAALDFMDTMDLCSLFGNALDNAIESVEKLPDSEQRLIHLVVARKKSFVWIRVENTYDGAFQADGTLPKTTKTDACYHGYGLKSIYDTAEKYGGTAEISVNHIAVVEDSAQDRAVLDSYLEKYQQEKNCHFQITHFSDGDEIALGYKGGYDLILMDIEMTFMDGMSAAEEIRRADPEVLIIFITNSPQYAIKGYAVQALDYILKPLSYYAFCQRMNHVRELLGRRQKHFLTVPCAGGVQKLDASDIYYVEICDHDLLFHTKQGEVHSTGSMRDVEQKLPPENFFRSSKAYLVNLEHVDGIQDEDAIVNGERVQISRAKRKAFLAALNHYMGETI